ncbi:MAG: (S)-ureidoglycine aminohydrolase [Verrucomicrobiota bacterium]
MTTTDLFGQTRTRVAARHALIAPDSHVLSEFPDWENVSATVILSPGMGAKLSQLLLTFTDASSTKATFPSDTHEHAFYLETGTCEVQTTDETFTLTAGSYLFAPSETDLTLSGSPDARLTVFRKEFQPQAGFEAPPLLHGNAADVAGEPFMGNPRALLKTLLPTDARFDLAMNIFTYEPGATLPFVETHIMEHGLLMLSGQGVYRLEETYYPVTAGDAIWMAPYCPQWFVAMGDEPASYLYYKDVNRLP